MAAVPPSEIPRTTTHPVRGASALLIRPRLHARLEQPARLTLVVGPPGAGKTALLDAWARSGDHTAAGHTRQSGLPAGSRGRRIAWATLDPEDREPSRFVERLAAVLERTVPGAGEAARGGRLAGGASPLSCLLAVVGALEQALPPLHADLTVGEGSDQPAEGTAALCLILDDYHMVAGVRAVDEMVGLLVRRLPGRVRIFIGSRPAPHALLVHGSALGHDPEIITPDDLLFTAEEVVALAALHGRVVPLAAGAAVMSQTGGWALGVALDVRSWREEGPGAGPSRDTVAVYLEQEVLPQQPADLRQFLLESALLGWFTAPDADAILERADSQSQIMAARQAGLFVQTAPSRDPARETPRPQGQRGLESPPGARVSSLTPVVEPIYRYHDVVATTLAGLLAHSAPARYQRIHERAATVRVEQGAVLRAVDHVLALRDVEALFAWLARLTPLLRQRGWWKPLVRLTERLPDAARTPQQRGLLAFGYYVLGQDRAALATAEQACAWARAAGDTTELYAALVLRANPLIRQHRPREALAFCEPALTQARAEGNQAAEAWLAEVCGSALFLAGRDTDGAALFQTILVRHRAAVATHDAAARERLARTLHVLAGYLVDCGRDSEAERHLEEATHLALDLDARELVAMAHLTRAILLLRRAQDGAALHSAQEAVRLGREQGALAPWMTGLHVLALARSRQGDTAGALAALAEQEELAECLPAPTSLGACLAGRAHVLIAAGDYSGARAALDRALALGLPALELGSILLEQGALAFGEGDDPLALRALREAGVLLGGGGLRPLQARALVLQAAVLSRGDKHAQAARCFARAGALVADSPWQAGLVADTTHAAEALAAVLAHWSLRGPARRLSEALRAAAPAPAHTRARGGPAWEAPGPDPTSVRARGADPAAPLTAPPTARTEELARARTRWSGPPTESSARPRPTDAASNPLAEHGAGGAAGQATLRFSPFGAGHYGWRERISPLARLGAPKAREALAFVLWAQSPVSRDALLDALWDSESTERSINALHYALYQLRRVVGQEVVRYTDGAYQVTCAVEDDVRTLLQLATTVEAAGESALAGPDGRGALAEQGLALYTGLYLPWCESPWAEEPRSRATSAVLTLIQALAEERWRAGQLAAALETSDRGLQMEATHEGLRLLQAQVLVAAGRRAEALDRYRAYERLLEEEALGPPAAAVRAFMEALAGAAGARVEPPGARPAQRGG